MSLIRCSTRTLAIHLSVRSTRTLVAGRRGLTNRPQSSPTRYESDPEASPLNVQNEFVGHTAFAFKNLGKVVAYTGYGALILGLITLTAFEGAHLWIEHQMRVVSDEDAERWGWEAEGWTGGDGGGTSPALGFIGRHAIRAAWFALYHGSRSGSTTAISQVDGRQGAGNLNVVGVELESARIYLEAGMARVRDQNGQVRTDRAGLDLLERHASVLERIGTRAALTKAREEYRQVFDRRSYRLAQARLAVKLGDLSDRLGDGEAALSWWARGVDLTRDDLDPGTQTAPDVTLPTLPSTEGTFASVLRSRTKGTPHSESQASSEIAFPIRPPSSPAAQRTLVAAILSLSVYYSKRKQLEEAKQIQEYAIPLIEAMVPTPKASSPSPPGSQSAGQTLHHMYLLHRKSVLAIHHAEVTYTIAALAKTSSIRAPLTDLLTAASLSEVVAQVLTGLSLFHPDVPSTYLNSKTNSTVTAAGQKVPHPPSANVPLLPTYRESSWLRGPASSILRDARLTAAEAWDLSGVLYGDSGSEDADIKALDCFERALGWAGDPGVGADSREGMSVNAWHSLWERFVEARERVLKKQKVIDQGR